MFKKKLPIYLQLIELFQQYIVSGKWPMDSQIESVRNLALTYQVNPNTVFKALTALEEQGLLINDGTLGKRVSNDNNLIENLKVELFEKAKASFIETAQELGFKRNEVVKLLNKEGEQSD